MLLNMNIQGSSRHEGVRDVRGQGPVPGVAGSARFVKGARRGGIFALDGRCHHAQVDVQASGTLASIVFT